MTAVNDEGASDPSPEVTATPTNLPGAPTFPNADPGSHRVFLSWSLPAVRGPLPISGYRVYCSTTSLPTVDPSDLCHSGGRAHQATVLGLVPGTTYYFVITAVNANGEGLPSEVVNATAGSVPSRPWAVRATARVQSIVVRWKPPTNDGGAPIVISGVFCSPNDPPPISSDSAVALVSANVARVTGLTSGTLYYCVVVAANQYGPGRPSAVVTATPL